MDLILSFKIPIEKDGITEYIKAASKQLHKNNGFALLKILSKSLDIRDQEQFFYKLSLVVRLPDSHNNWQAFPVYTDHLPPPKQIGCPPDKNPIVVGFGPAGMFAALELIDLGLKPIIFERGKKIAERSLDVQKFIKERELNPESNIQFGEGGAGSYSDGKLFSRRNNNSSYVDRVLKTFIKFGAPQEIAYISKPHLGTDVLCKIVRNIRQYILDRGGELHYSSKMTDILISNDKASGVIINNNLEYLSSNIFLALGHSARNTVKMLYEKGVTIEQRPIAVGVRIEHPVETINSMRYGRKYIKFPGLGAATYSLNYTNRTMRRGVYTFCMCPGGEIINASSSQGLLVLNGMSYSHRSSPFSNAGLVIGCRTDDYLSVNPLAGIEFQKDIERKSFKAGGQNWKVPAQNLMNFLDKKQPADLQTSSYKMGVVAADLNDLLPAFVCEQLTAAFKLWHKEVPSFISHEAILFGSETRTSSPVRITRNENYESVSTKNLYPIGEGSGYTGGITSSAADAIKAVETTMHISDRSV
nr:dehydrogenase [Desulfobulbaceae bacterium]